MGELEKKSVKKRNREKKSISEEQYSEPQAVRKRKRGGIPLIITAAIFLLLAVTWLYQYYAFYNSHFLPETYINGVNVSGLTVEEAEEAIQEETEVKFYTLYIEGKDGKNDTLLGNTSGINVTISDDMKDELEDYLSKQVLSFYEEAYNYTVGYKVTFDETRLRSVLKDSALFSETESPENAYIKLGDNGFEIEPEKEGNIPDLDKMFYKIIDAAFAQEETLYLNAETDYLQPSIRADDDALNNTLQKLKAYEETSIIYTFPDNKVQMIDKETIISWIDENTLTFDKEKIAAYVADIAQKYDTYGSNKLFKTALGDTITIGGGWYGWTLDQVAEVEQIIKDLETGGVIERKPIWSREEYIFSKDDDIGDTYIELDYTNQHLYYFKGGTLILDCDFVSGNMSDGNGSPDGVFYVTYKESPATLNGENYSSDVQYFMVFAYNIGIHDASWRNEFGGDIYLTRGSHGCINISPKDALQLYAELEEGTPVIAYYRSAVSLNNDVVAKSNAYSHH